MKLYRNLLILFIIIGCKGNKALINSDINRSQASINLDYILTKENIQFRIENTLFSPIRISLDTNDDILKKRFGTLTLQKLRDTIYTISNTNLNEKNLKINVVLGDLEKKYLKKNLNLPFAKGKTYKILQTHNGKFSHNEDDSRYAIDFAMKISDTVHAADNGYVVGVIDFNDKYGTDSSFKKYANFITTYNEETGVYSQYVHLQKNKVFVKVGQKVSANQPIALIGLSGFMDSEHLHFNTFIPSEFGHKSIPFNFENYIGNELKKDDLVKN